MGNSRRPRSVLGGGVDTWKSVWEGLNLIVAGSDPKSCTAGGDNLRCVGKHCE